MACLDQQRFGRNEQAAVVVVEGYEIRVIPPSRIVSVAGEVIIVLLWFILLLRLRRSIVNVCSISFKLLNCSRLLHRRAKVRMVVGRGA